MANIRTKKQKEKGQVGKKNYSLFNPGRTMPIQARPDDASKARTRKVQEQARNERFISPTRSKVKTELGRNLALGAGSIDRKTGKQIVSKDRDIPTRAQEKERADNKKSGNKKDKTKVSGKRSEENPSGSPFGRFSLLNKVIKGVDKLTGHKRKYRGGGKVRGAGMARRRRS